MPGHVFVSYAKEDHDAAVAIRDELVEKGFTIWMDSFDLLGGQDWALEIKKALRASERVIALISMNSVSKQGFIQKELRDAIAILEEFPPGGVFIIPVRLDNSQPSHGQLSHLQWIDLFQDRSAGMTLLERSLRTQPKEATPISNLKAVTPESSAVVFRQSSVLARAPLTNAGRYRFREPFEAIEKFRALVARLQEAGRWSYQIGMARPPELLAGTEQLETALAVFARDVRKAADEIYRDHQDSARVQTGVALAGDPLEGVRTALLTAAKETDAMVALHTRILRGITVEDLRASTEYQRASIAINCIEEEIRAAQKKHDTLRWLVEEYSTRQSADLLIARDAVRIRSSGEAKANVLIESRRRCALCFGLRGDLLARPVGHVAHIDRNDRNVGEDNLVYLCQEHHREYDSNGLQGAALTPAELRHYRRSLYQYLEKWCTATVSAGLLSQETAPFMTLVSASVMSGVMDLVIRNDHAPVNVLAFEATTPGCRVQQWSPASLQSGAVLRAPTALPGGQVTECIYQMRVRDRTGSERLFQLTVDPRSSPEHFDFIEVS